jgi:transcription initiation factor TFIID subunit 13
MEVRQRARPQNQATFPADDIAAMLTAFGDDHEPLSETVRVLDEVITEYVFHPYSESRGFGSIVC